MLNIEFTQQQKEMLNRFKQLKVGALFPKMGTGKTRVAVELVNYNQPDFLLYICPFSCKDNVRAELEKWEVSCPYEIVGYETLSASDRKYVEIHGELARHKRNFIIADESIFIKNGRSKRWKRACELRKLCEYALILNGTPIVKNERDIYNQMEFLSHDIFKMHYYEFLRAFFVDHAFKQHGREVHVWDFYEPNRPAFAKIIAPYVYMADLEFHHEITTKVQWSHINKGVYRAARDQVLEKFADYDYDSIISIFTTLASIAAEDPYKNDDVVDYITGKKCICYCSRKREIDYIQKHCDCYVIDGDTKDRDRKQIIRDFTEGTGKPLVLSFGVGSYSLNLQTADEIVYSSLTFNYGQYEQSQYRIKRLGQEHDIKYTYILANCGISKTMWDNLDDKEWLAEDIKKHIKAADVKEWIETKI